MRNERSEDHFTCTSSHGGELMKRKGFFMKKLFKLILSVLLMLTCVSSNLKIEQLFAYESNQYPVLEDAYIRSGSNASKNYNYENITSAHGSQYVGKD